jgi:hypothetical protein
MSGQTPDDAEQTTLAALESIKQRIMAYCQSFPVGGSASQMAQFLPRLPDFAGVIAAQGPAVMDLNRQGRPASEQFMRAMLADLANVSRIYGGMFRDRVKVERGFGQIWDDATTFAQANLMAALANQSAMFQTQQNAFIDVMEGNCFICHEPIGIAGGGYCVRCARRMGWII